MLPIIDSIAADNRLQCCRQLIVMLPIEKNKDTIEQIRRVVRRSDNIREVKQKLFTFISRVMELNSSFSQKINGEMTQFEQFVVKNSLYYQKSSHITNLSKLYREFSLQIERNAKLNIISLQKIKQDGISRQEQKLKQKCLNCQHHFDRNMLQEKDYNKKYKVYSQHCGQLGDIIDRYKSYRDPVSFYNKVLINDHLSELQKKHQECSTSQTEIITNRQMLDQQRGFIAQNIKEVNDHYFVLILNYLVIIQSIIKCIVFPKSEQKLDKTELNLNAMNNLEEQHLLELHRLQNLYSTQLGHKPAEGNPLEQFSELFRKSISQFQINSDYRFFHDRCDSIRTKKLKTSEETVKIQSLLVQELKQQLQSYSHYEQEYKKIQKESFTNNGVDAYRKRFRKYFGANFAEISDLCFNIIERQKKSLEKISKNMGDSEIKMKKVLENKKEAIRGFENRSKIILQDHLKLKEKVISHQSVDSEELQHFKNSIGSSFNQLKKQFLELEESEREEDKRFFTSMKGLYEGIMKEATFKNLNKLLQKQKNRINILNNMVINHEVLLLLKQDSRYQNLINQSPKPNLYTSFTSLIQKKQVDQTKRILQMKDQRLRNLIKPKQGCCGIKSEVVKFNILSQHDCKLKTQKDKYPGTINISSNGLIFEESTWFFEGLMLIIPQNDITFFQSKNDQYVEIVTEFGALQFESRQHNQIVQSMQKNLTFIGVREPSQPGNKRNDSSSFIKKDTSTEFRLSYDKSLNSNSNLSRVLHNAKDVEKPEKASRGHKERSVQSLLRDLVRKWKEAQLFAEESFKKVSQKNEKKRRDYEYASGHSKFFLRESKEYRLVEKDLILKYKWKVSFPQSQMLHSFRHEQQVRIQNITRDMKIRIVASKYSQQQLYIKNKFYKEIEDMNKLLCQVVVNLLEKQADIINQQQYDQHRSLESYNVVLDDINFEERDSKFQRTQSMLRNSKLEKRSSLNSKMLL